MLEYFTYKKIRKNQAEKKAEAGLQSPVLSEEDENFLERVVSAEGTPPALPERPHILNPEAGDSTANKSQMVVHDEAGTKAEECDEKDKDKGKGKEKVSDKEKKKSHRFSFLHKSSKNKDDNLKATSDVPPKEADKEEDDITRVLNELNLAAVNNRAFSISKESQVLVQKFTVILKDLINGVPTAYDDLVKLIDDSSGTLSKSYENLPSFFKKLIISLPNKFTSSLAPELLAVATEAQAFAGVGAASAGGMGAKKFFTPTMLKNLVTKPGAVAGMLKAIMNALKLRWPAFMGTNVLLSVGLFVLLFFFWYCHKRGKEVRLEKEEKEKVVDSNGRIVELEDDAMLPPPGAETGTMPPMNKPERIEAAPLRNVGAQNGAASEPVKERVAKSKVH